MPKIRFKRGPESKLPSLSEGEPGFTTDTGKLFVGSSNGNKEFVRKEDLEAVEEDLQGQLNTTNNRLDGYENGAPITPISSSSVYDMTNGQELNTTLDKVYELDNTIKQMETIDANTELVTARGGETNLNTRLDKTDQEIDSLSSSLAQSMAKLDVSVRDFGAVGDGVADDRQAIQNAFNYAGQNGFNVKFEPNKVYKIGITVLNQDLLTIPNDNMTIDLNGSTIQLATNSFTGYDVFYMWNKKNITIKNGKLKGDRLTHDYTTMTGTHEFGYGIAIFDSTCTVDNMEISDMTGDAIATKSGIASTVQILNSKLHHCRRQGITVMNSDTVIVKNCHIHHIGTFDGINGAAPEAGIDIEPASGTFKVENMQIIDTVIEECTQTTLIQSGGLTYGLISGCKFEIVYLNSPNFTIRNSSFLHDNAGFHFWLAGTLYNCYIESKVAFMTYINAGTYTNCTFKGFGGTLDNGGRLTLASDAKLVNCIIKDFLGITGSSYSGISVPNDYDFGNSEIINCSLNMSYNNGLDPITIPVKANARFKDSVIHVNNNCYAEMNNCSFVNCTTANNFKSIIKLSNCKFISALTGMFGDATKIIINSTIKLAGTYVSTFSGHPTAVESIMTHSLMDLDTSSASHLTGMKFYNSVLNLPNTITTEQLGAALVNSSVISRNL